MELSSKNTTLQKAIEHLKQNKINKAELLLTSIIDENDQCSESFFHLGNIFHTKGELGKAIKAFKHS